MNYLTLTFLGMLLLLQTCFAIPRPDAESPASHYEFKTDDKLYKNTIKTLVEIAIPLSARGIVLLQRVLEDLKAHEEAPKFAHQIEHLKNLIKSIKHIKADSDEKILRNIVGLKNDLAGAQKPSKESSNPHLVRDLVKKDGGKELAGDLRKHLVEFFDGFVNAIEEYAKGMSEEQKDHHKDFLKWFKEFKNAHSYGKRLDTFSEFFKFFHHK